MIRARWLTVSREDVLGFWVMQLMRLRIRLRARWTICRILGRVGSTPFLEIPR